MLAVEKRVTSTLIEPSSIEKIMEVDTHIGIGIFFTENHVSDHAKLEK